MIYSTMNYPAIRVCCSFLLQTRLREHYLKIRATSTSEHNRLRKDISELEGYKRIITETPYKIRWIATEDVKVAFELMIIQQLKDDGTINGEI